MRFRLIVAVILLACLPSIGQQLYGPVYLEEGVQVRHIDSSANAKTQTFIIPHLAMLEFIKDTAFIHFNHYKNVVRDEGGVTRFFNIKDKNKHYVLLKENADIQSSVGDFRIWLTTMPVKFRLHTSKEVGQDYTLNGIARPKTTAMAPNLYADVNVNICMGVRCRRVSITYLPHSRKTEIVKTNFFMLGAIMGIGRTWIADNSSQWTPKKDDLNGRSGQQFVHTGEYMSYFTFGGFVAKAIGPVQLSIIFAADSKIGNAEFDWVYNNNGYLAFGLGYIFGAY